MIREGTVTELNTKTRDEIAAAYDSPAWWYDLRGFLILTFAYNSTLPRQLRLFSGNIGEQHLELACGSGTLLKMMLKRRRRRRPWPKSVVAADYADAMLAGARSRFRQDSSVTVQQADAGALPFADRTFDSVNIANSVHCFPDVEAAIAESFRVLKPQGTLAANVLLHPRTPQPLRAIAGHINRWGIRKGILHSPYAPEYILGRFHHAGFTLRNEAISGNCYEVVLVRPE